LWSGEGKALFGKRGGDEGGASQMVGIKLSSRLEGGGVGVTNHIKRFEALAFLMEEGNRGRKRDPQSFRLISGGRSSGPWEGEKSANQKADGQSIRTNRGESNQMY